MDTGSFGSAIGGLSPELSAAIQRRPGVGGSTSPLNQVSNTAPTADPAIQPSQPTQAAVGQPTGPGNTSGMGIPFGSEEAKLILGSMGNYLKSITKFHGV